MHVLCKRPLNPKIAIFSAVVIMWAVGGVGLGLMHATLDWSFIQLGGYNAGTIGQIGGYYIARFGAQVPGLSVAAVIIALSQFRHPARVACFTVMAFQGIMTLFRLARHPWSVTPDLDQSIPVFAEITQLILMIVFIGLFTRSYIWFSTWLDTGPFARYFHR